MPESGPEKRTQKKKKKKKQGIKKKNSPSTERGTSGIVTKNVSNYSRDGIEVENSPSKSMFLRRRSKYRSGSLRTTSRAVDQESARWAGATGFWRAGREQESRTKNVWGGGALGHFPGKPPEAKRDHIMEVCFLFYFFFFFVVVVAAFPIGCGGLVMCTCCSHFTRWPLFV